MLFKRISEHVRTGRKHLAMLEKIKSCGFFNEIKVTITSNSFASKVEIFAICNDHYIATGSKVVASAVELVDVFNEFAPTVTYIVNEYEKIANSPCTGMKGISLDATGFPVYRGNTLPELLAPFRETGGKYTVARDGNKTFITINLYVG